MPEPGVAGTGVRACMTRARELAQVQKSAVCTDLKMDHVGAASQTPAPAFRAHDEGDRENLVFQIGDYVPLRTLDLRAARNTRKGT